MAKKFTRMDGETMPQFQARCRSSQLDELMAAPHALGKRERKNMKHLLRQDREQRTADRIDGFDRDKLGLSPDY